MAQKNSQPDKAQKDNQTDKIQKNNHLGTNPLILHSLVPTRAGRKNDPRRSWAEKRQVTESGNRVAPDVTRTRHLSLYSSLALHDTRMPATPRKIGASGHSLWYSTTLCRTSYN